MAEQTFIVLYCVCAIIEAILMCLNHKFYGDVEGAIYNIESIDVLMYLIVLLLLWFTVYLFYNTTKKKKGNSHGIKCFVNSKMHYFFCVWALIYIYYTITTGVGIVGSNRTSPYSFIFSMFDINVIFPFYYVLFREDKYHRKLFVFNIVFYSVLRILQGWTGFIVNIFLYELYFYAKRKNKKASIIKSMLLVLIILLAGAYVYKTMYPLKMAIRYNYSFSFKLAIPYDEALSKLTSRFSTFSRGTYALFNIKEIKKWYIREYKFLLEIQDIFRPIVPRKIMPDKDFMGLSSCIFAAACNQRILQASSSPGILVYIIMLFYCDPLSGIIWIFMYVSYFFIMRKICFALETISNHQMDILYFSIIISMTTTGSLNTLFSQQYMKLVFIVPLLHMFKIIKFRRNVSIASRRMCNIV